MEERDLEQDLTFMIFEKFTSFISTYISTYLVGFPIQLYIRTRDKIRHTNVIYSHSSHGKGTIRGVGF